MRHPAPLAGLSLLLPLSASGQEVPTSRFLALRAPLECLEQDRPVGPALFPYDLPWLPHDDEGVQLTSRGAVTAEEWRRWLEEAAATALPRVRLRGTETGLLAEGDRADLEVLSALAAEVEACLEARLLRGTARLSLGGQPFVVPLAVRSGDVTYVGSTNEREFVGTWNAEVAADSAVAEPAVWLLRSGWSLHLAAAASTSEGVRLHGRLEHSLPPTFVEFDPDTPDLGTLQRPEVERVVVEFAGIARPGAPLRVQVLGAAGADLEIDFEAAGALPSPGGWTVLDAAPVALPVPWNPHHEGSGWSASAVAAMLASPLAEASALWAGDLILLPPGAETLVDDARALLGALQEPNRPAGVQITTEDLRGAQVPLLAGIPSRLWHESVTTEVLGYRTELATDAWIAQPTMGVRRSGLELSLGTTGTQVQVQGWQRSLGATGTVDADALAQIGALQWSEVISRPVAARVDRGAAWTLDQAPKLSALSVSGGQ